MPSDEKRLKIIRALLETAFLAIFGHCDDCPEAAADEVDRASKNAIEAAFPHGRGNGTMQTMRSEFFNRFRKRTNELTGD